MFSRRRRLATEGAAPARRERAPARGRAAGAARAGAWRLARLVWLIALAVAGIVVAGILLVVLEANRDNAIVEAVLDAAKFLAGPFDDMFDLSSTKEQVAVNWGIAAALYLIVGGLIARLLRR